MPDWDVAVDALAVAIAGRRGRTAAEVGMQALLAAGYLHPALSPTYGEDDEGDYMEVDLRVRISAKYDGACPECDGEIMAGVDEIVLEDGVWVCSACAH